MTLSHILHIASTLRPLLARLLSLCALCAQVAGCAHSPVQLGAPIVARETFASALPAPLSKDVPLRAVGGSGPWWTVLGEPELDRLMALLESNSPNAQSSNAALRSARAALDGASAALLPTLSANGSGNRSGSLAPGATPASSFKAGLSPSWEVDLWGRLADGERAAAAGAESARLDRQAALLSARTALANAWLQARNLQRQSELGAQSAERLERIARITSARVELGASSQSDNDAAQGPLMATRADNVQTRLALSQAERAISIACGLDPSTFHMPPGPPPAPPRLDVAASQPAALLSMRPDVRAALARLAQADASRAQAEAEILPTLILSGSAASQAVTLGRLFTAGSGVWNLGAQAAASLFDGGARRANAESAAANVERADASYRQTALQALSEAEDALESARALDVESGLRTLAAQSAERSARASTAQYEEGALSRLALEQALAGAVASKSQMLDSLSRLAQARLSVARSFAGSVWDLRPQGPHSESAGPNTPFAALPHP